VGLVGECKVYMLYISSICSTISDCKYGRVNAKSTRASIKLLHGLKLAPVGYMQLMAVAVRIPRY
jgi:hypothetical protein